MILMKALTVILVMLYVPERSLTSQISPLHPADEAAGTNVDAGQILEEVMRKVGPLLNRLMQAEWDYATNITDHNMQVQLKASSALAKFIKEHAARLLSLPPNATAHNATLRRMLRAVLKPTEAALSPQRFQRNYTVRRMFRLAESFFTSLNLSSMPETFWKYSMLEKPKGRDVVCHASAVDFFDGADFRIKMCTRVDLKDLLTVHHEMGHVEYFLQYKDQPILFRQGANPGFHEAVGDIMALSVSTPKHLRQVGLLDATSGDSLQEALNHLYLQALQKIALLPFGYLMDLWRWAVFNGTVSSNEYNCHWWQLRNNYQGLEPPVDRTEEDFDPGAKYHIVANIPFIRYFVSTVLQFQIHRSLCLEAGEFDPNDPSKPLLSCDIHGSAAAGNKLKAMLRLGRSKPWPEALKAVTGSELMDASALLDYFRPLSQWLEEDNRRTGEEVGWTPSRRVCLSTRKELSTFRASGSPKSITTNVRRN